MRKIILSLLFLLSITTFAQKNYYTRYYADKQLEKTAAEWVKNGEWRNGYTKANPNWSLNTTEFYEQFNINQEAWTKAFKWLNENDLTTVPAGKHYIDLSDGTKMLVSVEDSKNDPITARKSESHLHVCDFMTVIKGTEGFKRLDHYTSTQNTKYKPDVVRYAYNEEKLQTINCPEGEFIIFFPSDWHIAKVETPLPDQTIRVIVIKVPYINNFEQK